METISKTSQKTYEVLEQNPLDESSVQQYLQEGIIKIQLPPEILKLKQDFLHDCCLFLKKWTNFDTTPTKLTVDLIEIAKTNRSIVGKLYKASKRFPAARKLSAHPYFIEIAKQLMKTELVSCYHLTIVRVDLPDEEQFLMPPHQDFPYIQGSINGITLYLGFGDLTPEHGIVSFKTGSHAKGIIKVTENSVNFNSINHQQTGLKDGKLQTSEKVCEIADASEYSDIKFKQESLADNEAFIFHTLLLHSSERNLGKSARLTLQIRFDDLLNQDSFNRNFPEGRSKDDLFIYNFPEYVVEK